MKTKFNWKRVLLFLLVAGGLIFITKSFWMSLGIFLLLFVLDDLARKWDRRRSEKGKAE